MGRPDNVAILRVERLDGSCGFTGLYGVVLPQNSLGLNSRGNEAAIWHVAAHFQSAAKQRRVTGRHGFLMQFAIRQPDTHFNDISEAEREDTPVLERAVRAQARVTWASRSTCSSVMRRCPAARTSATPCRRASADFSSSRPCAGPAPSLAAVAGAAGPGPQVSIAFAGGRPSGGLACRSGPGPGDRRPRGGTSRSCG